jgi:hypothetical protein
MFACKESVEKEVKNESQATVKCAPFLRQLDSWIEALDRRMTR